MTDESPMTPAVEVKPGYRTTEFWFTTLSQIFGMIAASGALAPDNEIMQYLGLAQMIMTKVSYTASRAKAKTAGTS